MALSDRENYLRTARLTDPEWMPWNVGLSYNVWEHLGGELEEIVLRHPRTWPNYRRGDMNWKNLELPPMEDPAAGEVADAWGCRWRTCERGVLGTVVRSLVEGLEDAEKCLAPDPDRCTHMGPIDWKQYDLSLQREREAGRPAVFNLDHGYFLLRLEYLIGYKNLMCGLAEDDPALKRLADRLHAFNRELVARAIALRPDIVGLPEDLGMQTGSMIGPRLFPRWVTPYHKELHDMVHQAGILTCFHCDGNIMDVADELLTIGPDIFNPQDMANGVENLAEAFKGRLCISLDFDRQHTLPFGSPGDIAELLEMEVRTLGSRRGGLMITAEVRGPVPPENIEALCTTLERLSTWWWER